MSTFLFVLTLLALAAGLLTRYRIRRRTSRDGVEVTDDVVRQIEHEGEVQTDEPEPLDREEIREEEDRFWEEYWDEPEPLF